MIDELLYTSAPRGLRPGSTGFCTVAATATLGPAWTQRLEAMSGYMPSTDDATIFMHTRAVVAGHARSVLSRIGPAGLDHTGRNRSLAHHVALDEADRLAAGPAWTMRQPGAMRAAWTGEPRVWTTSRELPDVSPEPASAQAWHAATGDAGWAGVLAEQLAGDVRPVTVICPSNADALALLDEAIQLLPMGRRWDITFTINAAESAADTVCRLVMADPRPAADVPRRGYVMNVADLRGRDPAASGWVTRARSGMADHAPATRVNPSKPLAVAPTVAATPAVERAIAPAEVVDVVVDAPAPTSRGIGFWLLAVGLPCVAICVIAIVLLMLSSRSGGGGG